MIDKRVFVGGMDSDTDDRLVAQGDYRRAINLRVVSSSEDSVGSAQNVLGNRLVLNTSLPLGRNKCIGAHRSEQRDSVIYFVFNNQGNHGIYEYKHSEGVIVPILINSILNFSEDFLITGISDIEGLLYWTDDANPPRKINIKKAVLHTASGGTDPEGYSDALVVGSFLEREKFINAIKAQPTNAPSLEFFTDPSKNYNRVRGKFLRFRYQFVYDDNEKSAWSEPSVLGYTAPDFIGDNNSLLGTAYEGVANYLDIQRVLNGILVTVNSSHETVSKIRVSVASGYNDFFLWKDFSKSELGVGDNEIFSVEYFGDSVLTPLDINESIKPFDDVPQKAKAQAIIEGDQIVYGNYETGYDPVDIDVSMSAVYKEATPIIPSTSIDDVPFGQVLDLRQFFSSFQDGGQFGSTISQPLPNDYLWHVRRWNIGAQQFKNALQGLGYELEENSIIEINYSLGRLSTPYSDLETEINTAVVYIPFLGGTSFDDPYFYLFNVLATSYVVDVLSGAKKDFHLANGGSVDSGGNLVGGNDVQNNLYQNVITVLTSQSTPFLQSGRVRFFDFFNYQATSVSGGANILDLAPFNAFGQGNDGYWMFEPSGATDAVSLGSRGVVSLSLRSVSVDPSRYSTFKSGSNHSFALVYFDAYGRSGFANASANTEVYVKSIPERNIADGSYEDLIAHIGWQINHTPPSWATHYAWVYAGNDRTDNFFWLPILAPSNESGIANETNFLSESGNAINLSLWRLQQFQKDNNNTNLSYDFSGGDRLSFIANPPTLAEATKRWKRTSEGNLIDVPITGQINDNGEFIVTVPTFEDVNPNGVGIRGSLVEIYKPKLQIEQEQRLYYTISQKYAIVNGAHSVTQGEFTRGDVYLRTRVYARPNPIDSSQSETTSPVYEAYVVEDPSINDNIFSRFYDRGKAYTVDNDQGRIRYIDQVTYSAPFVVGSKINGLSDFNPVEQPFKEYGRIYGSIQRLYAYENKLEVYQEDKVQYSLVSRDVIYNNQGGGSAVGTLSQVLSDAVGYEGEYGISNNPESWAQFGMRRYFVDKKRGVVCRLSRDGVEAISDRNMITHFRDTFERVLVNNRNGAIYGVYDPRFSEYVVCIEDRVEVEGTVVFSNIQSPFLPLISILFEEFPPFVSGEDIVIFYEGVDGEFYELQLSSRPDDFNIVPNPDGEGFIFSGRPLVQAKVEALVGGRAYYLKTVGETLAFSENNKRWETFYSFEPEFMSRLFNDICSFKGGDFYLHNKGDRNVFYGQYTPSEIWLVSNAEPSLKKFYKAIGLESDAVFVPYEITTPSGQRSGLIADDFVEREGYFYADILRDELTPSQTAEGEVLPNALFEGDRMRDYAIVIKLRNESGEAAELFAVNVVFEVSNLHGQE